MSHSPPTLAPSTPRRMFHGSLDFALKCWGIVRHTSTAGRNDDPNGQSTSWHEGSVYCSVFDVKAGILCATLNEYPPPCTYSRSNRRRGLDRMDFYFTDPEAVICGNRLAAVFASPSHRLREYPAEACTPYAWAALQGRTDSFIPYLNRDWAVRLLHHSTYARPPLACAFSPEFA